MTQYLQSTLRRARDERGITGLETAIILIAFVVVASVFAFTVLSTGVFSAERGKETVLAGRLDEAQASLSHVGAITAFRGDVEGTNAIVKVKFVVTTAIAGNEIDLTPPNLSDGSTPEPDANAGAQTTMILSYSDENQFVNDLDWTIDFIGRGYVNRCVNDIRRRPSQPLSQRRSHPRIERRDRRLRSTQGPSDA